jgi:hypothetical protein
MNNQQYYLITAFNGIDQKVRAEFFWFIIGRKGFRNFRKALAMINYDD